MRAVDFQDEYSECLSDKNLCISDTYLDSICKIHQGEKTCRYICLSIDGYKCVKNTPMKKVINNMVKDRIIKVNGDNCAGKPYKPAQ